MVTLIDTSSASAAKLPSGKVPPKAAPLFSEISVNDVAITESEVLQEAQNHAADMPGQALDAAARALVIRELLWQEAQRLEIEIIAEQMSDGSRETDKDAAIRLLMDQEVAVPEASKKECKRHYENNLKRFVSDPLFEARHILIACPENDIGAREKSHILAKDIASQLKRTPDRFSEFVEQFSDCPSRETSGNLGQLSKGSTVSEFEQALMQMKVGEILELPVETRFGFHIIVLDHKIEGKTLPFDAVEDRLKAWLEASSWSKSVSQYISILAGKADIRGIDLNASDSPLVQ